MAALPNQPTLEVGEMLAEGEERQQQLEMLTLRRRPRTRQLEEEEEEDAGDDLQELGPLPKDLLMTILAARLPVPKLFQLRLVCKSWDSMLRSLAFRKSWSLQAHHRPSESWFVMAFAKELIAWSPSVGSWFQFPPHSSINPTINLARQAPCHLKHSVSQLIVASSGGLVCAVIDGPGGPKDYSVCVFNILTGAVKRLPPHLKYNPCSSASSSSIFISMVTNSATGSYYVTLSEGRRYSHSLLTHLEVYDSKSGCWKVARAYKDSRHRTDISVLDGDLFLWFANIVLLAYTIEEDEWSQVKVRFPDPLPYTLQTPKVLKCKGRVLLVAGLTRCVFSQEKLNISLEGYRVCELQISSSNPDLADWVEVATMPSHFWDGFHYCNSILSFSEIDTTSQFACACHRDLICITGVHYTDCDYEVEFCPPLVYDLALGSWYRLPFYRGHMDFLCAFSFEPSLTAMV